MRSKLFVLLIFVSCLLLATSAMAQTWYVDVDWFDGSTYTPEQIDMTDNGDGTYTLEHIMATAYAGSQYHEFQISNGTATYPPTPVKIQVPAAGSEVYFTFDSNTLSDGWYPAANVVNSSHVLQTEDWVVVGSFNGWDIDNAPALTDDDGDGVYMYETVIPTAGTIEYKFAYDYSWNIQEFNNDGWGNPGGSGNSTFTTTADNATVKFYLDFNIGRAMVEEVTMEYGDFLVWAPLDVVSGPAIQAAIEANGYTVDLVTELPADITPYSGVFVCLGMYGSANYHYVIDADSPEALSLIAYLEAGGDAYIEGGDTWYWDPGYEDGTDFGPAFGIDAISDGASDLAQIDGVAGTFTEGFTSAYTGINSYVDHIDPLMPDVNNFRIFTNPADGAGCGIAYRNDTYNTIGTSFQFAGVDAALQNDLMADFLNFMASDPVIPTTICDIDVVDENCLSVLDGQLVEQVVGVITVKDEFGSTFYFQQDGCGLGLFGYDVQDEVEVGDLVSLSGTVGIYYGTNQITNFTSYEILQSGVEVTPELLTIPDLGEMYEGLLIRVDGLTLNDPSAWPTSPFTSSGVNLTVSDADGNEFTLRIDKDTNLNGSPTPTEPFDLVAILGQYDNSEPFCEGYQFLPRMYSDIIQYGPQHCPPTITDVDVNMSNNSLDVYWDLDPGCNYVDLFYMGSPSTYHTGRDKIAIYYTPDELTEFDVLSTSMYFYNPAADPWTGTAVRVYVHEDDGGMPGAELGQVLYTQTISGVNEIDLSGLNLGTMSGNFWIVYDMLIADGSGSPYPVSDNGSTNGPNGEDCHSYAWDGTTWNLVTLNSGAYADWYGWCTVNPFPGFRGASQHVTLSNSHILTDNITGESVKVTLRDNDDDQIREDVVSFNVYRDGSFMTNVLAGEEWMYIDTDVELGTIYCYEITAIYEGDIESIESPEYCQLFDCIEQVVDHNNGNVVFTVSNEGNFGYINGFPGDPGVDGSGFVFGGADRLFEGALIVTAFDDTNYVSDGARDETQVFDADFDVEGCSTVYMTGDEMRVEGLSYTDALADHNPIGVLVEQTSYSYATAGDDEYVIVALAITNQSGAALSDVRVGMFMDWDVGAADRGGLFTIPRPDVPTVPHEIAWIGTEADPTNATLCTAVPLSQNLYSGTRVLVSDGEVYPPHMTDTDKLLYVSTRQTEDTAEDGGDRALTTAVGPFDLAADETITVGFAYVGGVGQAALSANVEHAILKWAELGYSWTNMSAEEVDVCPPENLEAMADEEQGGIMVTWEEPPAECGGASFTGIEEGFEDGVFPADWQVIYGANSTEHWDIDDYDPGEGLYCATVLYDAALNQQDEWIVTPELDLTDTTAPELSFMWLMSYYWMVDPNPNGDLNVKISVDGGATWTQLWREEDYGVFDSWTWYTQVLDLSAYIGETVHIGFNYYALDAAQASVDLISVYDGTRLIYTSVPNPAFNHQTPTDVRNLAPYHAANTLEQVDNGERAILTGYNLKREDEDGNIIEMEFGVDVLSYLDTDVEENIVYCYAVEAIFNDGADISDESNIDCAMLGGGEPIYCVPDITDIEVTENSLDVYWDLDYGCNYVDLFYMGAPAVYHSGQDKIAIYYTPGDLTGFEIVSTSMYFYEPAADPWTGSAVRVYVHEDDGGMPGAELGQILYTQTLSGINEIDLSSLNLGTLSDNFWIVYDMLVTDGTGSPYPVSDDGTTNGANGEGCQSYAWDGTTWTLVTLNSGAYADWYGWCTVNPFPGFRSSDMQVNLPTMHLLSRNGSDERVKVILSNRDNNDDQIREDALGFNIYRNGLFVSYVDAAAEWMYNDTDVVYDTEYCYQISAIYPGDIESDLSPLDDEDACQLYGCIETVVDHNNGNVLFTVSNEGNFGYINGFPGDEDVQGSGFVYDGADRLFEGALIITAFDDTSYVSDGARDETQIFDADFLVEGCPDIVMTGDEMRVNGMSYTDANADYNPIGVLVEQTSYSYANAGDDEYVIIALDITNQSGAALTDVRVGMFLDWDVSAADRGGLYSTPRPDEPTIMHEVAWIGDSDDPTSATLCSVIPLSQNVYNGVRVLVSDGEVYPPHMTDADKLEYVSTRQTVDSAPNPGDRALTTAVGPFDLAVDETITVGFAFVAGTGVAEMTANVEHAILKWTELGYDWVGIEDQEEDVSAIPMVHAISQNFPNPFNPTTTINFALPVNDHVNLSVYNSVGQLVKVLVNQEMPAAYHSVVWDGKNNSGSTVSSGIYYYRIKAGDFDETMKMMLLK